MNFTLLKPEIESTLRGLSRQIRQYLAPLVLTICLASSAFAAPQWKLRLQADQAYRNQDYTKAMSKYLKLANEKAGDSYAECQIGIMYAKGEGVQPDDSVAAKWYERAGGKGNAFAASNLG